MLPRRDSVSARSRRSVLSVPREVQSEVDTRLVGKAEMTIAFSNYSLDEDRRGLAGDIEDQDR